MSFSERLKQSRREKGLSQEELAEMLEVSRQAVSKWEQGLGYPEVEKLLLLSKQLHVSLDDLMAAELCRENFNASKAVAGELVITSPHENVAARCYKVLSSHKMKGGKGAPQYALFGVGGSNTSFWGEPTVFLGWYADEEHITKEIGKIQSAIARGLPTYELSFSVKVERHWLGMKIRQG